MSKFSSSIRSAETVSDKQEVSSVAAFFKHKAKPIQARELIDFIETTARELSHLAILVDSTFLAYLLSMAAEEARQLNTELSSDRALSIA